MAKIIGSICVLISTMMLGIYAASEVEAKYNETKYIRKMLFVLQSEIQYSRSYLAEAFCNLSGFVKSPYNVWLRQLNRRLEEKNDGSIEQIWKETIDEYLVDVKIPKQQKEQLKELGTCLGCADISVQVKHMEFLGKQLELAMTEMREELNRKKKLYRCLGGMSGVFITILLI